MVKIRERKQERFRFPVALHLIQAVGALTLHTGVGTISYIARAMDIKNARSKVIWRAILACIKCNALQMYVFVLEWQKKSGNFFDVSAFYRAFQSFLSTSEEVLQYYIGSTPVLSGKYCGTG